MNSIHYDVPLITQGLQECAQASAAQLLNFFGGIKSVDEVKKEVPVFINKEGQPLGTSIGHIATYFIQQGFRTSLHTTDIALFDRSWVGKSSKELIALLEERQKYIKHPTYTAEVFDVIFDGYISFLKQGGKMNFPIIDEAYIVSLLKNGPLFAVVSYNFLNSVAKYAFRIKDQVYVQNSIKGNPSTHSIVIAGHKNNSFYIVDPDFDFGGKRWIDANLLVASLYVAQTDFDSILISLEK